VNTIAQFVQQGIKTDLELQCALQTAMRLEFSTIPPYLCAQWSINTDPSDVAGMIRNIVIQEMYHFALAGNILAAIRGVPTIANKEFIPTYPTDMLPGEIHLDLELDLHPISKKQLSVFMEIEKPEFPPVSLALTIRPATIGAFYDTIIEGFRKVQPLIKIGAPFVGIKDIMSGAPIPDPKNGQITTVDQAIAAIARIKREGEGTKGSPEQPPDDVADGQDLAHYYVFKEIHDGKKWEKGADGHWRPGDKKIILPTFFPFKKSTSAPDPSAKFNALLSQLLTSLQNCWIGAGAQPNIGQMMALENVGGELIRRGVTPGFMWTAP
jgi:hypothetical protein